MKRSTDLLRKLVIAFSEVGSYTGAASSLGLSNATVWRWLKSSDDAEAAEDTSSPWYFEIEPGQADFFGNHCRTALLGNLAEVEAANIRLAAHGWDEIARYKGKIVYDEHAWAVGLTDEQLMAFGYSPNERFVRNPDGTLKPSLIHHEPAAERSAWTLERLRPENYRRHDIKELNVNAALGVTVIAPKQIAKPIPEVEVLGDADASRSARDASGPSSDARPQRDFAEARRTTPGVAELEALAAMSPTERQAKVRATRINYDGNVGRGVVPSGGYRTA
jgi:hypothetical protein